MTDWKKPDIATGVVWNNEALGQQTNVPVTGFDGRVIGTADVGKDGHVTMTIQKDCPEYELLGVAKQIAVSVAHLGIPAEATVDGINLREVFANPSREAQIWDNWLIYKARAAEKPNVRARLYEGGHADFMMFQEICKRLKLTPPPIDFGWWIVFDPRQPGTLNTLAPTAFHDRYTLDNEPWKKGDVVYLKNPIGTYTYRTPLRIKRIVGSLLFTHDGYTRKEDDVSRIPLQ